MSARTENGTTTTYEWDAENRLIAVKQGANTLASYTYNGEGRRVSASSGGTTLAFIYDKGNVTEERGASTTRRRFHAPAVDHHLGSLDAIAGAVFVVSDHLRSVRVETSSNGTILGTRDYDPYGRGIGSAGSGLGFTGREWMPEVSLLYNRARYYDPGLGRFFNEDPIRELGGLNFFAYAENRPVQLTDPFGLKAFCPDLRRRPRLPELPFKPVGCEPTICRLRAANAEDEFEAIAYESIFATLRVDSSCNVHESKMFIPSGYAAPDIPDCPSNRPIIRRVCPTCT